VTFATVNSRVTTPTLAGGNLTRITNPDGGLHSFSYDANHRLTQGMRPADHVLDGCTTDDN
jgi:YD repeat-containing protein